MHLTMRAMNEFHRAAVAGPTTNVLSMRARSACSNHLPCRVVKTLHQIPHANPTLQGVSRTSVRGRPGRLAPNPLRSHCLSRHIGSPPEAAPNFDGVLGKQTHPLVPARNCLGCPPSFAG